MKYKRELKVAALAILCIFLLIFGMHFLKGVNMFSPTKQYVGHFQNVGGLTEQAAVFVRGYKVGQVDAICYDFSQEDCFTVTISIDKSIAVPEGSEMRLIADGLLGGKAIEVYIPLTDLSQANVYKSGDILPTSVEIGLMESIQSTLMAKVDSVLNEMDTLLAQVNSQISGNQIKNTLTNVERISADLAVSSKDIKHLTHEQLPVLVENADTVISNLKDVVADVNEANITQTVARIDTAVDIVNAILTSKDGTLGLLLNDKDLYKHIDSTVVSVDKLVIDLKANPKRYVHFSLFGGNKKDK